MKSLSITFSFQLDVVCANYLDSEWVADQFNLNSARFSVVHIHGDPSLVVVQAASSGVESVRLCRNFTPADPKLSLPTSPESQQAARRIWRAKHPLGRLFNMLDRIL